MFPDDTSVTSSEPTDFDTVKLEAEKSTNVSVKKLEKYSYTRLLYVSHALIIILNHAVGAPCTNGYMLDFVNFVCFDYDSVAINSLQIICSLIKYLTIGFTKSQA